jgi:cell division protease FtsH
MISNYILCIYGAFCLFNNLNVFQTIISVDAFKNIYSLSKPTLNMNPEYIEFIRESATYGRYGNEWSYQDLVANIQHDGIEFVSIMNNANILVAMDKSNVGDISVDRLHYVKLLPNIVQHAIDMFIKYKVQFVVDNVGNSPQSLTMVGLKLLGVSCAYTAIAILFYLVRLYLFRYIKNSKVKSSSRNSLINLPIINRKGVVADNFAKTTFEDVAGCDEAKFELQEVVDFLKHQDRYKEAGAIVPRGVLLEGPPGTGKTLLAKATAGEAGVSFISKSASEFVEVFVGVGASRVRDLFEQAERHSPCIIFIDEIDAIGRKRDGFGSNDERDQTLNQLLTNMDGFEKTDNIIVLASTNRVDILDKALLRPGRFDRKVTVGLPDKQGRKEILDVHLKGKRTSNDVDLNAIYDLTTGFSGAELANLVNEAAIMSVRKNVSRIDMNCFNDAYEKTTIGLPKSKDLRDKETREMVAYHESGHAIVAKSFSEFVDVRKVTINANNNGAGGYTLFTPKERYVSFPSRKYMFACMVIAMGGRAAEMILFNRKREELEQETYSPSGRMQRKIPKRSYKYIQNRDSRYNEQMNREFVEAQMEVFISSLDNDVDGSLEVTLGSSSDVKRASEIARQYISVFGTNDALGAGLEWNEQSEHVKGEVDARIAKLIKSAQDMAVSMLDRRDTDLQKLSLLLLDKGTVSGNEVP